MLSAATTAAQRQARSSRVVVGGTKHYRWPCARCDLHPFSVWIQSHLPRPKSAASVIFNFITRSTCGDAKPQNKQHIQAPFHDSSSIRPVGLRSKGKWLQEICHASTTKNCGAQTSTFSLAGARKIGTLPQVSPVRDMYRVMDFPPISAAAPVVTRR